MATPRTTTGWYDLPPVGQPMGWQGAIPLSPDQAWNRQGGFNRDRFQYATTQALGDELGFGNRARADAYKAYRAYDPSQAFETYYSGVLGETGNALADALTRLGGQAAGAGRLDTGFLDRDQGDTVRRFYADALARGQQAALQTAGMRQAQLGGLLDFGSQARQQYLDLLSGAFDRQTGIQNSRAGFGDYLGGALQTAASVLPFVL